MSPARLIQCCTAAIFLFSAPLLAQTNTQLQRGIALLENLEEQKALEAFEEALKSPGNSTEVQTQIHLYRGIALFNLLETDAAKTAFWQALSIDKNVTLPDNVSPKIKDLFESLRTRIPEQQTKQPAPVDETKQPGDTDLLDAQNKVTTPTPQTTPKRTGINWWAWSTAGFAAACLGTGLGLGIASKIDLDNAEDPTLTTEQSQPLYDAGNTKAIAADILFGIGGAAAITSAVLFIFYKPRASSLGLTPMISPHTAGISISAQNLDFFF